MHSQDLTERYGAPAPWRRRAVWIGSALVGLVALGWLLWTMLAHAQPPVDSDLVSFEVVDQHTATARVEVRVEDDAEDVSCLLRAFAEDHVTVGEHSFVPEAGETTRVEEVRTERLATAVELVGCTADGQPRPS